MKLTQYTTEDGLSQNTIYNIQQDDQGFLWISTSEGLNIFDGYRMSTIDSPTDNLQLYGNEYVRQDSTGLIWIGSNPQNNYLFNKETNELRLLHFEAPPEYKLEYPVIVDSEEDLNSDVWVITYRELYFYDRSNDRLNFVLSLPDLYEDDEKKYILRDIVLVEETLVIATSNGVYSLDTQSKKHQLLNHLPDNVEYNRDRNDAKTLIINKQGQLLIGAVEGLYMLPVQELRLGTKRQRSTQLIENLNVWDIIEKDHFYWVATNDGLYKYTPVAPSDQDSTLKHVFRFSDTPFATSDDDIVSMIEDREGILWLGTNADGVFKWRPNEAVEEHWWENGEQGRQLVDDQVNDILYHEENIWIATNNGLTQIDYETGLTKTYFVNLDEKAVASASTIYSISVQGNKMWLNTAQGIERFDLDTLTKDSLIFPQTEKDVFNSVAMQVYPISEDRLLIVNDAGIYDYDLATNTISLSESTASHGDDTKMYYGFFDTSTGIEGEYLLAGLDKLVKYDIDTQSIKEFHQLKKNESKELSAGDILKDNDSYWVTYSGLGLYKLDANTGKELEFFSEESIGANSMMDLFPDAHGNLWITTNDGLFRMNKFNYQFTKFDRRDGFASSEFMGATKVTLDTGAVLLGSVKGVYLFDPSKIHDNAVKPIMPFITNVSLLSKKNPRKAFHFNDSVVNLQHNDFGLNVGFSAMLFDKPEQVKFYYWLSGDSQIEKTPVGDSELFFSRFQEGKNKLYISAVDYRNGLESQPAVMTIISHPAWWASRNAIIVYSVVAFFLALINWQRYRRKQIAKEQTLLRIKRSEERLNLALKGSKSGLWDWHAKEDRVFEPRILDSKDSIEKTIPFQQRLQAIHLNDQNTFTLKWRSFLRGGQPVFDANYRMKDDGGLWQWYRDVAMISELDVRQRPTRVTGTFTNITEVQSATEKMRLYSHAFENALDSIIILDRERKITAGNLALQQTSGWSIDELIEKELDFLLDMPRNRSVKEVIFRDIESKRQWSGESFLKDRKGNLLPVLMSIALFVDDETDQCYVLSISDISKQKEAESELKKLVNYDPLTSMPNRTLLIDRISRAIPHCDRAGTQLAVFFVDLDRFKQINDTLGHDAGDKLLIAAANVLKSCCREGDTVARLGGDEFVVMLEDLENVRSISRILQSILDKISEPFQLQENLVTITASIGVSIYPQDAADASTMLKHADIAMYHAKNAGRNNFRYFQDFMNRAAKYRLTLEGMLRTAVEDEEFSLVYQPLFDISTGSIRGVEALARWRTKSGENISPGSFIPLAEELALIIPITEKLMQEALESLDRWNVKGREMVLAFNISAVHIYHDSFIEFIDFLIDKYPKATQFLELELTESILMEDIHKARKVFEELHKRGIELALDDFGTGYSSLKYLSRLPISKLKIDMSFVQHIGASYENDAVIQSIISLAKSLRLKTVAEGIESYQQFNFLKNADVDYAQGYLFSKPIRGDQILEIIDKNIYENEEQAHLQEE
ncbi:MAG: EAL domain-containing protein [Kangiellaceae bacterium]|nr:EAL domain-containing protein [Kangiellaceae bacterium]